MEDAADRRAYVLDFDSLGAAQVAQARLAAEGVASTIEEIALSAGFPSRWRLRVGVDLAHRARWILVDPDVSDRELAYLATGELDPDDDA